MRIIPEIPKELQIYPWRQKEFINKVVQWEHFTPERTIYLVFGLADVTNKDENHLAGRMKKGQWAIWIGNYHGPSGDSKGKLPICSSDPQEVLADFVATKLQLGI